MVASKNTKTTTATDTKTTSQDPCRLISSRTFAEKDYPLSWMVKPVLITGQPAVIGGPQKSLKTNIAVDLAISMATGRKFLDRFDVPRARRVAVFSGESGEAVLKCMARRICRSKGMNLGEIDVMWGFDLPKLSSQEDCAALGRSLRRAKAELVIVDPLYLCLLNGGNASDAANLYAVGSILRAMAKACLDAGATPVVVHHTNRSAAKPKKDQQSDYDVPLGLTDLAFAGIAEFSRQWILVKHREPYRLGSGLHHLVMSVGGSAGHSALYLVDIDEGVLHEDMKGRRWRVTVSFPPETNGSTARAASASCLVSESNDSG